jgi:hypothetical protein
VGPWGKAYGLDMTDEMLALARENQRRFTGKKLIVACGPCCVPFPSLRQDPCTIVILRHDPCTPYDTIPELTYIVYPKGGTFVPTNLTRENIKRIIILPRPEGVENSQGLISAVSKYLSDNAGWFVAPPELALEIASRTKVSTSSLDAIDPNTGEVDMQRYLEPQRSLVMTIAKETRLDAVLEVRVTKVKANVHASAAFWDDMTEAVATRKSRAFSLFGGLGGKG